METQAVKLALLRELYAGFVRARGISRHFRRFTLFESLLRDTASREALPPLADALLKASRASPEQVLASLGSHPNGLTESQAADIRMRVGLNEVGHEKPLRWYVHLWRCYRNPFNLLLTVLAAISFYTEDVRATIVIGAMVLLSTLVRFFQETRSNRAADRLKEMVSTTATVLRRDPAEIAAEEARRYFQAVLRPKPPRRVEIRLKRLVPGDVVLLSAGDMIPADIRLLSAKDLFVSQSAMTGESLPVEKFSEHRGPPTNNPLELDNIAFMGTNVVSGSATGVVVTIASQTYFGALAQKVTAASPTTNAFQTGVNKVSWLLIRFMIVMTPIVLLINGFTKGNTPGAWTEAFLFALSIAVGLTSEMLPMIVTSNLAKGAVYLSRQKVIIKRLDAIQNCGAFGEDSDTVLEIAYLNSYYQTGLKNLLDVAVLEHVEVQRELAVSTAFRKVDEIPFDFTRRRMSVVVAEQDQHHLLICKGAVEEILAVCTHVQHDGVSEPSTEGTLAKVRELTADLNEEGLRVVAVAIKQMPPTRETYSRADECDLTLVGYIAFLDPPKESSAPALKALAEHGVAVKILTGDNHLVTRKICKEVGLPTSGIVLGADVEAMSDEELAQSAEQNNVFARLTPA